MTKFIFDNEGQTCNKFWGLIYPLADSLENGTRYVIPFYDSTIDDYPFLLGYQNFYYPFYSSFLHRKFGAQKYMDFMRRLFRNRFFSYNELIHRWPHIFIDGWKTRKLSINSAYVDEIRYLFTPSTEITSAVDSLFNHFRTRYDLIVGVHIRRGDYQFWRNGDFFFSFEDYAHFCKIIKEDYPEKKKLFFLSSNEEIDFHAFSGCDTFTNVLHSASADLYALSKCDLILGPPSSFSRFASFIGSVPMSFILDKKANSFIFKRISNFGTYEDGSPLEFDF